jgi:glycosyltransferase involved in cell wall biosynthesis
VTVLQVLAQDDLGGTELMLASLIERLDERRVSCELGLLSTAGPIATRLGAGGIRVHALGGGGAGRTAIGLARLLRRGGYDVVNAYGLRAGLAVRVIARLVSPRTRVVIGVRGLLVTEVEELASPKAKLALWLERATSRLVDLYDSNSRGAAELIVSLGIDSGRVRYIPNGLDLDLWPANGAKGSTEGPPLVASVARFVSRKRHQDLLHALALLNSAGVPFRAVLAGAGPTLETCRGLSVELGLEDRVEFPGRIAPDQVAELLEHAQVGCLSSLWEGMPGFVMEAMAARLPVVATAVNGPDELVVDGQTGFLVPAKDPEAMMQALRTLLEQPALAARFGQAGRDRIERDFSLDSMVTAKQSLYEGLVAR